MIILKKMTWDYWFSYGKGNSIDFSDSNLTQIIGSNGSGKSSIMFILEELLFGKNSKNIKKTDLKNRKFKNQSLLGTLEFTLDKDNYLIKLERKSTVKLSLYKNNKDISSHTSKQTYSTLSRILNIDFKTFSQIVYQSSNSGLEFLTATDTQRKNFLISLLNLEKYTKIYNIVKEEYRDISKRINILNGSRNTVSKWISTHENEDFNLLELKDVPEPIHSNKLSKIDELKNQLKNISTINKQISTNNTYKDLLAKLDINILTNPVEKPESVENYRVDKKQIEKEIASLNTEIRKLESLTVNECPTCKQQVNLRLKEKLLNEWKETLEANNKKLVGLNWNINVIEKRLKDYKKYTEVINEFEKLSSLIRKDLNDDIILETDIKKELDQLNSIITKEKNSINKIIKENKIASEHNTKINTIKAQLDEYYKQEKELKDKLSLIEERKTSLDILKKSFSTNGLISYKIEFLVKDLEEEINNYLGELSSGKFQLSFILNDEKLNIHINDNGKSVDIQTLSSGELARVVISTLLAIRKLMSNISNTKTNLLFLDEIMGVLDDSGKEKLVEILLEEKDLNTFLISHEYTHPLLDKLIVTKENGISRIEDG